MLMPYSHFGNRAGVTTVTRLTDISEYRCKSQTHWQLVGLSQDAVPLPLELDMDQIRGVTGRRSRRGDARLRCAPVVDIRDLVHA